MSFCPAGCRRRGDAGRVAPSERATARGTQLDPGVVEDAAELLRREVGPFESAPALETPVRESLVSQGACLTGTEKKPFLDPWPSTEIVAENASKDRAVRLPPPSQ